MDGALWAAVSGVVFGVFQATNRRAHQGVDAYLATFTLLAVSAIVLAAATAAVGELDLILGAPPAALGWFALAGAFHFFLGWTFLGVSQRRLGASRTSVVIGTTPLFGTGIAFIALGERVRPLAFVGVVLVVAGIALLTWRGPQTAGDRDPSTAPPRLALIFPLLTALCWAISPVFIRWGLDGLSAPIAGVTTGMVASAAAYGAALVARRMRQPRRGQTDPAPPQTPRGAYGLLVVAGVLAAAGIAAQWTALELAPVAVVLALGQLSVPVVVLTAPLIVGVPAERLGTRALIGAAAAVVGTLVIIVARSGVPT